MEEFALANNFAAVDCNSCLTAATPVSLTSCFLRGYFLMRSDALPCGSFLWRLLSVCTLYALPNEMHLRCPFHQQNPLVSQHRATLPILRSPMLLCFMLVVLQSNRHECCWWRRSLRPLFGVIQLLCGLPSRRPESSLSGGALQSSLLRRQTLSVADSY